MGLTVGRKINTQINLNTFVYVHVHNHISLGKFAVAIAYRQTQMYCIFGKQCNGL